MTISWGSWEYSSGNGMRVGIETTISTVNHTSTTVTATFKVYTQNQYTYSDNQTLTYGGSFDGDASTNYTNNDGGTAQLRYTNHRTYTYGASSYGSSPGGGTFSATVSGAYNGVTPSKTVTWTIPARPYDDPVAPSSLNTARTSDTVAALDWTNNASAGHPYTSQSVRYIRYGYDSDYGSATSISGSAVSVNMTTAANFRYRFQIRANNTIGSSSYTTQSDEDVLTTPAAPPTLNASVVAGTGVVLTWTEAINYSSSAYRWRVHRQVNGGGYALLQEGISGGTLTYTDASPPAGTLQYRVQAYTVLSAGAGGYGPANLTSAWKESASIATATAPLAPTGLSPSGVAADAADAIVLTWVHNHGGDYAAQTHYQYRYSSNGGGSWTTSADIASTDSTATIAGGTLTNGLDYIWQVRTEGTVSAGYGPYSASATLAASSTPTVTITAPGATTTDSFITLTWDYNQSESVACVAWQAQLYQGTTLLEESSGTDEETTTFAYPVTDGVTYTVNVRAQSADLLWSDWDTADTEIDILPPASATLVCTYDEATGSMSIDVDGGTGVGGVSVDIDTISIERRVNGVGDWLPVADPIDGPDGTVIDYLPSTSGQNEYQAVILGVNGSHLTTAAITCTPQDCDWVRINYGSRLSSSVRVDGAPEVSAETGRARAAVHFLGTQWPSIMVGDQLDQTVNFKGVLHFDPDCDACTPPAGATSTAAEWETASQEATAVMFRDHAGRRLLGVLSAIQVTTSKPGIADLSFSVTRIDDALEATLTGFPDLG